MVEASPKMLKYFETLDDQTKQAYALAQKARKKGFDPEQDVEIKIAKNMAERVVGLISVVAPQIVESGVVDRIIELEKEFGILDWRVAFQIAYEIAQKKLCEFESTVEAIEVGVKTGFAYATLGVVSAPLEGLTSIDIVDRRDKKGQFFRLNYAGPIRNAGGTAAAVSVLIADFVRKKLGYAQYDPDEKEIKRCHTELSCYHERVTNLQYFPSEREVEFLMKYLPVEIAGDPSEKWEVSNYKDLPRIPTNLIRSGFCLIHSSCIPLKAPKLWKQLSKWGKEFDMEQWSFLEEFIAIQKEVKSKSGKAEKSTQQKISPDYTFIADLVAGRPILGHPLAKGAFRLRYGRGRASGYSGQSIHPATMLVLDDYIATGTQLKVERPGKGATYTPCDTIQGPIVKLEDGSVHLLSTVNQAKAVKDQVKEILFLGDVLINYGDFLNRAHTLVPPGYCEEWWALDFEEALKEDPLSTAVEKLQTEKAIINQILKNPFRTEVSFELAKNISSTYKVPLHPKYTYHWADITTKELELLLTWFNEIKIKDDKAILPLNEEPKRVLECLGVPHLVATEFVVIEKNEMLSLTQTLNVKNIENSFRILKENFEKETLDVVNLISPFPIKDKSGVYIGSRMGRPEKAKMRKMTGNPHTLFPVGEEGGRLRSFQAAFEIGHVSSNLPLYVCEKCSNQTAFGVCEKCGEIAKRSYYCQLCDKPMPEAKCEVHGDNLMYQKRRVIIREYFNHSLRMLKMKVYPDLIKGVRGTTSADHSCEHLAKGILRATHDIFVNKDGTVRYDATEAALTHFKPKEIATSVEKLREMGYEKDVYGDILENDNQVLEIKPQDVVLPACPISPNERADDVMFSIANYVDDLLVRMYGVEPFYNLKSKKDLVGHLIIGLAPHTSAGMVGRIIGFSKTQTFLSHPYYHASCRRDVDGDEIGFLMLMDGFLNFSKRFLPRSRGSTMDAPLVLSTILIPGEVDDMAFDVDVVWKYPLEFYKACEDYKKPWEIKLKIIDNLLGTPEQYEGMGFTHDTEDINEGVLCSAYKTLPSMQEKLAGQMVLAEKIRAVDESDVARLVIEKHFIRDTKGNLRKFSQQQFRCVVCNEKFRRPPLIGKCTKCNGKILFTISEGSIVKYLEPSISLAAKYNVPNYLKQTLELLKRRVEGVFGRDKEKQLGLGSWF
jgi:DNA polymerase II large subunit